MGPGSPQPQGPACPQLCPPCSRTACQALFMAICVHVVLVVKNPPASAGDVRDMGSTPGSETSPGGFTSCNRLRAIYTVQINCGSPPTRRQDPPPVVQGHRTLKGALSPPGYLLSRLTRGAERNQPRTAAFWKEEKRNLNRSGTSVERLAAGRLSATPSHPFSR